MDNLTFYAPIEKTDAKEHMVYGYASTEALDSQGEVVKKEALSSAIDDYMKWANIREMHTSSAVGKTKKAQLDNKGLYIAAKIVDKDAWEKVEEGVYNGFSIGGRVETMKGNEITGLKLSEISIVDRPANPECKFDVFKADFIKKEEIVEEKIDEKKEKTSVVEEKTEEVKEETKAEEIKDIEKKEVKKGMYEVSQLSQLVDALNCVRQCTEWEAQYEGDNSPIPQKLKDAVVTLSDILKDMTAEETTELTEDKENDDSMAVEMAELNLDLQKIDENIQKGVMPTEDEINKMLDYMKLDKTQKNVDMLKWEMAGKIMEAIQKQTRVIHEQDKEKLDHKEIEKKEEVIEKAGREISADNEAKIQSALDALNNAVKVLADLKGITPAEKDKLKNGVKAGSNVTGGDHIDDAPGSPAPMDNKSEQSEITKLQIEKPEQEKDTAYLAKVESELSLLKGQMEKLLKTPLPVKAKASFVVVEKGFEGAENNENAQKLKEAEAESEELQKQLRISHDPQLIAKAAELSDRIMRLHRLVK